VFIWESSCQTRDAREWLFCETASTVHIQLGPRTAQHFGDERFAVRLPSRVDVQHGRNALDDDVDDEVVPLDPQLPFNSALFLG
jgi:hypothetical protein